MKEKIILITGATNGIGKAAATEFARQGATVILTARNQQKGQEVVAEIQAKTGSAKVSLMEVDLASGESIRQMTTAFKEKYDHLNVLVNNAGGFFNERLTTPEGHEYTFGLNHLGYFQVTTQLLDLLKSTPGARIVNVASEAQRQGRIDFGNLMLKGGYSGFRAYCNSKLANIVFTNELSRRLEGTGVTANSLHPGVVKTGFGLNNSGFLNFLVKLAQPFMLTPEQGAETMIWLATSPQVEGVSGKYWAKKKELKAVPQAYDPEVGKRLWEESERLTGSQQV
ncbi:MAG: SDR family oxidoreductase [Bacteroidia bacterium]|nr:SDR family oxidoreductase [Bacteroidia bacterium]